MERTKNLRSMHIASFLKSNDWDTKRRTKDIEIREKNGDLMSSHQRMKIHKKLQLKALENGKGKKILVDREDDLD
jgi:hypothetical protein